MIQRRRIFQMLPGIALAGCSSPPAKYYRIIPIDGAIVHAAPETIRVRQIGIPSYLNQNGIAEPSGAYQFIASANNLWAEPLPDMLQSVLVQDLTQRLPEVTVTSSSGMVGTPADLLVEINILRFDPDASGHITLIAQTALKQANDGRFLSTRTLQSSAAPAGTDIPSMMAAMSALWAGLADAVAEGIAEGKQPLGRD